MTTYRYSGGRFPQSGDEAVDEIVVNMPMVVALFPVVCVFILFGIMAFAAADTMSVFGGALSNGALVTLVAGGGVLPIIAAYAVAGNHPTGRWLALLQVACLGYLIGISVEQQADPRYWHVTWLIAAAGFPFLGLLWTLGPTKAARYFDVIAGKPPHPSLLTTTPNDAKSERRWAAWHRVIEGIFEILWIGFALFLFIYGGLNLYLIWP